MNENFLITQPIHITLLALLSQDNTNLSRLTFKITLHVKICCGIPDGSHLNEIVLNDERSWRQHCSWTGRENDAGHGRCDTGAWHINKPLVAWLRGPLTTNGSGLSVARQLIVKSTKAPRLTEDGSIDEKLNIRYIESAERWVWYKLWLENLTAS